MHNNEPQVDNQISQHAAATPDKSVADEVAVTLPNTLFGIDVSHYNGTINWPQVLIAGVKFVYLKATESATIVDKTFATNRKAVKKIGLPCGAYHFFRPKMSVASQVDNFCKTVGRLQAGDLPPVLDIEVPEQWQGISQPARISMIVQWLTAVEKRLGVQPIVYIGNDMAAELAHDPVLKKYVLWLAYYTDSAVAKVPAPWTTWTIWQYGESGQVKGVPGKCDVDRFAGAASDLDKLRVKSSQLPLTHRILNWFATILG